MTAVPGTTASAAEIRSTIDKIVRTVLGRDVERSVDMFDQGATSLALIRIVTDVNTAFGIETDVANLDEASVDALTALVTAQLDGRQATSTTAGAGR